ncbi:MAG: choice-of-anchor D domain-containing protein [Planctomycetes bacterium]|nr:choice-of-anchor D domain-containing protein [Planctomycetota bacterium]
MTSKLPITNKNRLFWGAFLLALAAIFTPPSMALEVCGLSEVWIISEPEPVDINCETGYTIVFSSTVNLLPGAHISEVYGGFGGGNFSSGGYNTINIYAGKIDTTLNTTSTDNVTVYGSSFEPIPGILEEGQKQIINTNADESTLIFTLMGTYQDGSPCALPCYLEYGGVINLNVSQTAPEIEVFPATLSWDFGAVKAGEIKTVQVQIYNIGTADLKVSSVTLAGDAGFTLTSGPVIDPNDPNTLLVIAPSTETPVNYEFTFTPSADGPASAVVRIVSDDKDESVVEVVLAGLGTSPEITLEPASLDFGSIDFGTSVAQNMTIANYGDAQLMINSIAWTEDSSADFAVFVLPELPLVIEPNGIVELSVVYTPTTIGAAAATLEIGSDDPEQPLVTLAVAGIGVYPPLRQINDIIAFYDESVQNGTIQGVGPGKSAQARVKVIKEALLITKCLIQSKYQRFAIVALMEIDKFTDGDPKQKDFITGPAVAELNAKINTLITTLKTQ